MKYDKNEDQNEKAMNVLPLIVETGRVTQNGSTGMNRKGAKNSPAFQFLGVVLVPIILYGCAPKLIKIEPEERVYLKNQSELKGIHYPPPSFSVMKYPISLLILINGCLPCLPLTVPFGLVVAYRAVSSGARMIKNYSLQDPSLRVKDHFISSLQADLGLQNIQSVQEPMNSDKLGELKRAFEKGIVIDFKTTVWFLSPYTELFPKHENLFHWTSHYRISYQVRSRIIRLEDSKTLWQGYCRFVGEEDFQTRPTMVQLIENSGALLKVKLNEAADACAERLLAQFFGKE